MNRLQRQGYRLLLTGSNAHLIRALLQAGRELDCDRLLVLTADTDAEDEVAWYGMRGRIRRLPVWRWLSEPPGGV